MEDVIEGRYVTAYIIWLRFEDGTEGEVDLSQNFTARSLSHFRIRSTSPRSV